MKKPKGPYKVVNLLRSSGEYCIEISKKSDYHLFITDLGPRWKTRELVNDICHLANTAYAAGLAAQRDAKKRGSRR